MSRVSRERLSSLLGFEVYHVRREPVTTGGLHSRVYACASAAGDLVLRVCRGQQGYYTHYFPGIVDWRKWMDQRWAVDKARKAGVSAPEIVYSNRSLRWVVMKRLPGVPVDSRYDQVWQGCPYDESAFGAILRRLHGVAPLGWGPINDEGTALFHTWAGFTVAAARSAIKTCRGRNALPAGLGARLEKDWVPALQGIDIHRPSLLHLESLGFANLLYDPNTREITGFLDYEDCIGGDPLFELVWMRYYFEHDSQDQTYFDFDRFGEGYGATTCDDERMPLYQPFPYLDKLRWIPAGGDRARSYVRKLGAIVETL